MIPEVATPEGLRARADIMRGKGDESCARHLELAAEALILLGDSLVKLARTKGGVTPLDDPELAAASYSAETADEDGEARIVLYSESNQKGRVLGYLILPATEVYDLAATVLRCYDSLEGIK